MLHETSKSKARRVSIAPVIGSMCDETSASSKASSVQSTSSLNANSTRSRANKTGSGKAKVIPMAEQRSIENVNAVLIDRLDRNVILQTEILSRLEKLMAVQEEKIDQQEKLGANLVKMMEQRRIETEQKFDQTNKKIDDVERAIDKTIVEHLTELRNDQKERHTTFVESQKSQHEGFALRQEKQLAVFTEELTRINEKTDSRLTKIERVIYGLLGITGFVTVVFEVLVPWLNHK